MFVDLFKMIAQSPRFKDSVLAKHFGLDAALPRDTSSSTDVVSDWTAIAVSGDIPSRRSGHSACYVGDIMYVFGGYDQGICQQDLYAFDTVYHTWQKMESHGDIVPDGRASHAMCASSDGQSIYLFGGSGPVFGSSNMDELMKYSIPTQTWSILDSHDHGPPSGYGQTMCIQDNLLLLFGGTSGHIYVNDLYVYNLTTKIWTLTPTHGDLPSPRYKHQSILYDSNMYIFGGGLYDPAPGPMEVYRMSLHNYHWEKLVFPSNMVVPESRIAHTMVMDTSVNTMYLFAGRNHKGDRLNDLWSFQPSTGNWTYKQPQIDTPAPIDFHSCTLHRGELFIFGGSNGQQRANTTYRYQLRHQPNTLFLLAIKAIQRSKPAEIHLLPPHLRSQISSLNQHVLLHHNQ